MHTTMKILALTLLLSSASFAAEPGLYQGASGQPATLDEALSSVTPGAIVVIGEAHGNAAHQQQQLAVLRKLREKGLQVAVGLEFLAFHHQPLLDSWRAGKLAEADFLEQVSWGSIPFSFYRDQALFPEAPAKTIAINAPWQLPRKVGRQGLASLTEEERRLLPPNFTLGQDSYKKRFLAELPHLDDPSIGERYFAAQSVWDETMAYQSARYIGENSKQVLVIVVGEFHAKFGGGLPDRLRARAPRAPVLVISQIDASGLSEQETQAEIRPSEEYGPRADFVWVSAE